MQKIKGLKTDQVRVLQVGLCSLQQRASCFRQLQLPSCPARRVVSRAYKGAPDLTITEAAARAGQPEAAYWIFSLEPQ